jgi:hypothetical protein
MGNGTAHAVDNLYLFKVLLSAPKESNPTVTDARRTGLTQPIELRTQDFKQAP